MSISRISFCSARIATPFKMCSDENTSSVKAPAEQKPASSLPISSGQPPEPLTPEERREIKDAIDRGDK